MKKISTLVKELTDKELKESLKANLGLFFFNYTGVPSADLTKLRRELSTVGTKLFVTKNSFIKVALKNLDIGKDVQDFVQGSTALIFVKDDPVGPSKILVDFAKTHEAVRLQGGFINKQQIIQQKDFKVLASIPSRQVLYAQVASALNAPIAKLAMSLNQIIAKLCYALKAVGEKKQ